MKKVILVVLLVTLMMAVMVPLAYAAPPEKVAVCHLNGDGNYIPINIASPALDAHLAHGDGVVDEDLDENCEPLVVPQAGQAGCMQYNPDLYFWTDGSSLQYVGNDYLYSDDACANQTLHQFLDWVYAVWAISIEEAKAICNSSEERPTLTENLYACGTP
jgi:hypothetical protein